MDDSDLIQVRGSELCPHSLTHPPGYCSLTIVLEGSPLFRITKPPHIIEAMLPGRGGGCVAEPELARYQVTFPVENRKGAVSIIYGIRSSRLCYQEGGGGCLDTR